jgi:hypothetical protein
VKNKRAHRDGEKSDDDQPGNRPEIAIADPGKADLAVNDRGSARREIG